MKFIDASKGYLTETYTYLGRHHQIFKTLEDELKYETPSSMSCLVIGPGIAESRKRKDEYTNTYQPFELANILRKIGIRDYNIDVIDINPQVMAEFDKRPALMRVPIISKEHDIATQRYYGSFFPNNNVETYERHRVVKIPENVTSRFNLQLGDIIKQELPKEKFDVVVCTVLLSHYYREMTGDYHDPIPGVLKKIEESVKPRGYLIDTEKGIMSNEQWELIKYHHEEIFTIHPTGASLYRKK